MDIAAFIIHHYDRWSDKDLINVDIVRIFDSKILGYCMISIVY